MGKLTVTGLKPPDDPMFSSGPQLFSRPASSPSSTTSASGTGIAKRDLRAAYLATDFVFEVPGQQCILRVGEENPKVRNLLAGHGVHGAAYVTACNPASLPLGEVHNAMAMQALRSDLNADGDQPTAVYVGYGQDRVGKWPPEPSLMLLGISRAQAELLGRRYGQYAIVWVDETGTASLVELADLHRASRYPLKNPPFKWIELGFEWGDEWASIRVTASQWRRILAGESLGLKSKTRCEGKAITMYWSIDGGDRLRVSYGEGGTAYDGSLTELTMSLP